MAGRVRKTSEEKRSSYKLEQKIEEMQPKVDIEATNKGGDRHFKKLRKRMR